MKKNKKKNPYFSRVMHLENVLRKEIKGLEKCRYYSSLEFYYNEKIMKIEMNFKLLEYELKSWAILVVQQTVKSNVNENYLVAATNLADNKNCLILNDSRTVNLECSAERASFLEDNISCDAHSWAFYNATKKYNNLLKKFKEILKKREF